MDKNNTVPKHTPFEESIDELRIKNLKKKLHDKIYFKRQLRMPPSKKDIKEQSQKLQNMMKHPKMNNHILDLYTKAIEFMPTDQIPNPVDIFNQPQHYKEIYYKYILALIQHIKQNNLGAESLDILLNNPYGKFMSTCLSCPLNPLKKIKSNDVTVPELINTESNNILEQLKTNEILNEQNKS